MTRDGIRNLAIRYRTPVKLGLSLVGAVALAWILANPGGRGTDAYAYWYWSPADPYREGFASVGGGVAFRYAPPIGLLLLPGHALTFPAFLWLWTALTLGALAWLCRSWTLAVAALYPVLLEISVGNVHLLMAAAIVIGFRFPEAWAFVLLTKITPGVGLAWFAIRREWTSLARALGITAAVSASASFLSPRGGRTGWRCCRATLGRASASVPIRSCALARPGDPGGMGSRTRSAVDRPFRRVPRLAHDLAAGVSDARWGDSSVRVRATRDPAPAPEPRPPAMAAGEDVGAGRDDRGRRVKPARAACDGVARVTPRRNEIAKTTVRMIRRTVGRRIGRSVGASAWMPFTTRIATGASIAPLRRFGHMLFRAWLHMRARRRWPRGCRREGSGVG